MKKQKTSEAIGDEILELYSLLRNKYDVNDQYAKEFISYLEKFVTDTSDAIVRSVDEATKKWKAESNVKLNIDSVGFKEELKKQDFFSKILENFKKNKRYKMYKPVIEFLVTLERAGFLKKEDVQEILNNRIASLENLTLLSALKMYEKMELQGSMSDRWN
jgi:predicted nucleic-acid-binding protein